MIIKFPKSQVLNLIISTIDISIRLIILGKVKLILLMTACVISFLIVKVCLTFASTSYWWICNIFWWLMSYITIFIFRVFWRYQTISFVHLSLDSVLLSRSSIIISSRIVNFKEIQFIWSKYFKLITAIFVQKLLIKDLRNWFWIRFWVRYALLSFLQTLYNFFRQFRLLKNIHSVFWLL